MLKKQRIIIALICVVFLMAGCSTTAKQKQLISINSFNSVYKQYLDKYDAQTDEVKAEWKEKIDPLFKTASDAMKVYAKISDPTSLEASEQSQIYTTAINSAIELLLTYGIEIKEE